MIVQTTTIYEIVEVAEMTTRLNGVKMSKLVHLSHQVIDKTNNAYKFVAGIDGADKFGKMCAEIKSDLIDFKLPLAA